MLSYQTQVKSSAAPRRSDASRGIDRACRLSKLGLPALNGSAKVSEMSARRALEAPPRGGRAGFRRRLALGAAIFAGGALSYSASSLAQPGSGGGAPGADADGGVPPPSSAAPAKPKVSCTEYLPDGATRPELTASLPDRGLSGHALRLTVKLTHGQGETVMSEGFHMERGSDGVQVLKALGWVVPDPDGGSAFTVERVEPDDEHAPVTTTVTIPFVPLPETAGRHELTLPPVPITVTRANGKVMTVCTPALTTVIDDPIANEVDPEVRPNPPPRPQREEWVLAKQVAWAALGAIVLGALLAWLLYRLSKRPKVIPPVPKPLPWLWAMKELEALRASPLLGESKHDEYFDRVDDVLRRYLGERYGFDAMDSTSEEIRGYLKRVVPPIAQLEAIHKYLEDADFVKFAEFTPSRDDCEETTGRVEEIVRATTPPLAVRIDRGPEPGRRAA
jgi:hypothetical protein